MKFILFQCVIIIPFIAGIFMKRHIKNPHGIAKKLISVNLIAIEPATAFWSIWGYPLSAGLLTLPLGGIMMALFGLLLGAVVAPIAGFTGKKKATYIISSSLANQGITMGGFLCYLLMGEKGLALSFIFIAYFMPYIFLFIFPFARRAGMKEKGDTVSLNDFVFDLRNMPIAAIVLALALNTGGIARPGIPFPMDILIMITVSVYYFTLGLTAEVKNIFSGFTAQAVLAFSKFALLPLITFAFCKILTLDKTIEAVLMIESFMPAAIYSVISTILFDLDTEFASRLFIVNTLIFMVLAIPMFLLVRGLLF